MWGVLCIPTLAAMAISDLRSRRIGLMPLLVFGGTLMAVSLVESGERQVVLNTAFNFLIVLLLWIVLLGYAHLRKMRLLEMIGGGDIGFVLALLPYFEPHGYVLFLIVSSTLTLVGWLASGVRRKRSGNVPLITGIGTCLIVEILYKEIIYLWI